MLVHEVNKERSKDDYLPRYESSPSEQDNGRLQHLKGYVNSDMEHSVTLILQTSYLETYNESIWSYAEDPSTD